MYGTKKWTFFITIETSNVFSPLSSLGHNFSRGLIAKLIWYHVEILSKSDIFFLLSSCTFCHLGWEHGAVDKAPLRRAITSTPALLPKPIWTIQSGIVLWFPEWTSSFHLSGSVTKFVAVCGYMIVKFIKTGLDVTVDAAMFENPMMHWCWTLCTQLYCQFE
jgi:hypothetical protein